MENFAPRSHLVVTTVLRLHPSQATEEGSSEDIAIDHYGDLPLPA